MRIEGTPLFYGLDCISVKDHEIFCAKLITKSRITVFNGVSKDMHRLCKTTSVKATLKLR